MLGGILCDRMMKSHGKLRRTSYNPNFQINLKFSDDNDNTNIYNNLSEENPSSLMN